MGKLLSGCILLLALLMPSSASAHAGPPFIVVPEQMLGPYRVIIWADPDVGTGTLLIETSIQNLPPPPDTSATVTVWPSDQPDAQSSVAAERQNDGGGTTFIANPEFDREGEWTVRVQLTGSAPAQEVSFTLDVTPPYPTWLESLPCLIPFVVLGVLWWMGVRRARRQAAAASDPATPAQLSSPASVR